MSTFPVQPQTPYDISIGLPGIAGTPTPVVSYAWTYNGTPIGDDSRFVNGYTFPSFPGTLACTITLTNIVGSVSQTVTATIEQVSNLPSLSPVTIRNNAAPTVPISTIGNGNAGVVLRVGGPTAPDVNPVSQNASAISYQWRRAASNIAGATGQTYTLVADDEDQTISVLVTATNPDGSTSRTATLTVGDALPNANSHIGSHLPSEISNTAYTADIAFANLMYMAKARWEGGNGTKPNQGLSLWEDYDGEPFCTADGWPLRNRDGSPLSAAKPAEIRMIGSGDDKWRAWSILQMPGEYTESPEGADPPAPDNLKDKKARFTLNAYWQGSGKIKLLSTDATEQQVTFAGPLNEGPWGTGPVNMRMKSWTGNTKNNCEIGQFKLFIESTDPNDPIRNIILLISDVRYVISDDPLVLSDPVYEGFDHTNYRPYALYPSWVEKNKRMKILRNHGQTKVNHVDNVIYAAQGPEYFEGGPGESRVVRRVGWLNPPNSYGFETGHGAMNRPTHILHGVSLKAQIEICNQLRADWWHSHPVNVVYPGTRTEGQPDAFAEFGDVMPLLVDQDYITNLVPFIAENLDPGLKVYSEMCNELWNKGGNFNWNHNWAYLMGQRMMASVEHGGDGTLIRSNDTLGPDAYYAGKRTFDRSSNAQPQDLFSYAGAAILAKEMRALMPAAGFEVVAVAGSQFGSSGTAQSAFGQLFMRCPKLFKELDAIAIAPYRSPTFDPGIDPFGADANSIEADANLASLGSADAAWEWIRNVNGQLEPYSSPIGAQDANGNDILSPTSFWSLSIGRNSKKNDETFLIGYPAMVKWKHMALDVEYSFEHAGQTQQYNRKHLFSGAPARRWNLKLVCYEAGNHYIPNQTQNANGAAAKSIFSGFVMSPPYRLFMRRYYEYMFAPNIKGLTRDPASGTTESEIYRPGMVPNGIASEREPIVDHCVMLATITEPAAGRSWEGGMYWGLAWFTSQVNAPQYVGLDESVDLGIGTPNWWVNYEGYLE